MRTYLIVQKSLKGALMLVFATSILGETSFANRSGSGRKRGAASGRFSPKKNSIYGNSDRKFREEVLSGRRWTSTAVSLKLLAEF